MALNKIMDPKQAIKTPILFLIFSRPDTTQMVFQAIRKARPGRLFVAADGPRENRPEEAEKCQACRAIIDQVDWECEVHTLFRETNLGLKLAVSSAITWFFDQVEEGIILEDDCIPSQSFFCFCQELLEKYRDDERVMSICGNNFQDGRERGDGTYYFSRVPGIWGWATWRRAWKLFDPESKTFPQFKEQQQIKNIFQDKISQRFFISKIQDARNGGNTWGFPWVYAVLANNGLCATPNVNLVSNCGCGPDAVHAIDPNSRFANIPAFEIDTIIHPLFPIPDKEADAYFIRSIASEQMEKKSFMLFIKSMIRSIIGVNNYEMLKKKIKFQRS